MLGDASAVFNQDRVNNVGKGQFMGLFFNRNDKKIVKKVVTKTYDLNGGLLKETSEEYSDGSMDINKRTTGLFKIGNESELNETLERVAGNSLISIFSSRGEATTLLPNDHLVFVDEHVTKYSRVKCQYCETVFSSSEGKCPSCGAPYDIEEDSISELSERLEQIMKLNLQDLD